MLQEYLRDTHTHNIDLGEQGRETSGGFLKETQMRINQSFS